MRSSGDVPRSRGRVGRGRAGVGERAGPRFSEAAQGEFIGVMKLSAAGASELVSAFDAALRSHAGKVFREGRTFEKAYLIDLLEHMLTSGSLMHREDTAGGYMEIDTLEDLSMAETWWKDRPSRSAP